MYYWLQNVSHSKIKLIKLIFLVCSYEKFKQYRLNIPYKSEGTDMEEVKLIAGTILYFLGVIYFTECWFTQISILIGSILGLRCVLAFQLKPS